MKNALFILCLGLLLSLGPSEQGELFQVITSHPHDLEEMAPHMETVYQNGRLWIVELHKNAPKKMQKNLRPLTQGLKSYMYEGSIFKMVEKSTGENEIESLLIEVDENRIKNDVVTLAGFKTRRAGTEDNREAVKGVARQFEALGFKTQEVCYDSSTCNLIAERKGSHDQVLMIMGHIDSVGEDFAGADDNASGVAVMLEMARVLKNYKNQKTIRFFVSNGEEGGLIGSTYYAKMLEASNQLKELGLVINMDMVGYNSNGIVELETDRAFESVAKNFAHLASQYTSLKTKITIGAWGSDHVPFLRRGVPALLTIEDWDTKTPCYHRKCDRPDTLNYEYAAEIAKLNLAAILNQDSLN